MPNKPIITGFLEGRGEYDYQAGANSPVNRVVLKENSNWKDIKIDNEIQVVGYGTLTSYDTLMCVSFNGNTDAIEYLLSQQIKLGIVPSWKVQWLRDNGYFKNGQLNFNERFTAIMGETSEIGAYQYKVADGMRKFGLIPQDMFPMASNFKDNIDKKFVTQAMYDLGKKFTELFKINYEWTTPDQTEEFIKYSPLACFGKYGNIAEGEPLDPQNGTNHSMLQIFETSTYREIDDSYWEQFKKYKKSALQGFMAFYVDSKDYNMFNPQEFINTHDKFIVRNQNSGAYGVIYQKTPMAITEERAGLFVVDRDVRGLLGKGNELSVSLAESEFNQLDWSKKF